MSHYIPLEYDRSHLLLSKKMMQTGVSLDYYDIVVITINSFALLAIFIYYISKPPFTQAPRNESTRRSQSV